MIRPSAGKMRGAVPMRDPDGILLSPFTDESGTQYGYVIIYGQGVPAVYDGETWHNVISVDESQWEEQLQNLIVDQGSKIAQAAMTSPVYAELAKVMNIFVGAGVGAPTDTTFTFGQ